MAWPQLQLASALKPRDIWARCPGIAMAYSILRRILTALGLALLAACASVMPGGNFPKSESHALPPVAGEGVAGLGNQVAEVPRESPVIACLRRESMAFWRAWK